MTTPKNELGSIDSRRPEVKRAGDLVSRWRDLAEQRLEHLIELYQSGRWQKYYNETDFLKQIREVVAAVEAWKQLVPPNEAHDGLRSATMNVWKDIGGGDTSLAPVWQSIAPNVASASSAPLAQGSSNAAARDAPLAPVTLPRDNAIETEAPSILPKAGSSSAEVLHHLANAANRPSS